MRTNLRFLIKIKKLKTPLKIATIERVTIHAQKRFMMFAKSALMSLIVL